MSAISIREVQRKLYGGKEGPPILPHGDDLETLQERRRARKRQKLSPGVASAVKSAPTTTPAATRTPSLLPFPTSTAATTSAPHSHPQATQAHLDQLFPASDIPAGFPPDLVFRALAAYATVRTLSLKLRLSPFTPVVFLRALHLPVPTRLLGHVHVALLRLLIPHLQQHYHWGAGSLRRRFPWLPHTKKRKLDGLRWTLRAGDDLEYLDHFTWPLFLDDYAHLTADQLYWCATGPPLDEFNRNVDDPKENPEVWRNLDVSQVPPDDWVDPAENVRDRRRNPQVPSLSVLYLNDTGKVSLDNGSDEDIDEEAEGVPRHHGDEDEDFDLEAAVAEEEIVEETHRKRKRGRPRKSVSPKPPPAPRTQPMAPGPPTAGNSPVPLSTQNSVTATSALATSGNLLYQAPHSSTRPVENPAAIPSLAVATMTTGMSSPSVPEQGTVVASSLPGITAEMINSTGTTDRSIMQKMSSNYWMQQQLQSKLNATIAATTMKATTKPRVLPSVHVEHQISPKCLPAASHPIISQGTHHGSSGKAQKSVDPKLAGAASLLESYTSETNLSTDDVNAETHDVDKHDNEHLSSQEGLSPQEGQTTNEKDSRETADDNAQTEPPFVWAHFEAIKELRSGKAYHDLSVENKLILLEYLIDEVLMLDMVASEMTFRYDAKEHFDLPYGDLPKDEELEELENDDQCAVCLGEGDLLCCDGCPSSYHQQCVGLSPGVELPDGKWFCPECTLVDPSKFGPLREAPKSSVDWFRLRDVCRAQKHLLSLTATSESGPTEAMAEEKEYLVVHGFVFCRSLAPEFTLMPGESPAAPRPLSKTELVTFLTKVGTEDRGRWPLAQIPSSDFASAACPTYLSNNSTFDPNVVMNKYRNVPPLLVPKKLNILSLQTVEDSCSRMDTLRVSEVLTRSMKSDALVIEKQGSRSPLFSECLIACNFAREVYQKILKAMLFPVSNYVWATEAFLPMLSEATSVESVSKAFVALIDAIHPRAFQVEWFESPSHKSGPSTEVRKRPGKVYLCEDSTPTLEASRRTWQCMQPGNVICALSKNLMTLDDWASHVKPELIVSKTQKSKRKRDNQDVKQTKMLRGMVDYSMVRFKGASKPKHPIEEPLNEMDAEDEEGYHFRTRHEKETDESTAVISESMFRVESHIAKEQEKLVDFVHGLPEGGWIGQSNWPVAGRRLFEPIGELPRHAIRRMARRAGSVRSPFVFYSQAYEVGQAACYHIWRKQMLTCTRFEDLLLGMRTMANFLDYDIIRHATKEARKQAKQSEAAPDIYCCCTDLSSGEVEYLVLEKNAASGTWTPSRMVDIKSLISYQWPRIAEIKSRRKEKLKRISAKKGKVARKDPPPQTPRAPPAASRSSVASIPSKVDQIVLHHNQEILRLFYAFPNILRSEFSKARAQVRATTASVIHQTLKSLGIDFDLSAANTFLATHEKLFLETQQSFHPVLLNDLYPPAEVGNLQAAGTLPQTAKFAEMGSRRPYKCGNCGELGHNKQRCPHATAETQRKPELPKTTAPAMPLAGISSQSTQSRFSAENRKRSDLQSKLQQTSWQTEPGAHLNGLDPLTWPSYSNGKSGPGQGALSGTPQTAGGNRAMSQPNQLPPRPSSEKVAPSRSRTVPNAASCPPHTDPRAWNQFIARQAAAVAEREFSADGRFNAERNRHDNGEMPRPAKSLTSQPMPTSKCDIDVLNWKVQQPRLGPQVRDPTLHSTQKNGGELPSNGRTKHFNYADPRSAHPSAAHGQLSHGNLADGAFGNMKYGPQIMQFRQPQNSEPIELGPNKSPEKFPNGQGRSHDANLNPYSTMSINQRSFASAGAPGTQTSPSASGSQSQRYMSHVVHGSMGGMSEELLAGLEPTPLRGPPHTKMQRNSLRHGAIQPPSSQDSSYDTDLFSPTPIHPDHKLNKPHQQNTQTVPNLDYHQEQLHSSATRHSLASHQSFHRQTQRSPRQSQGNNYLPFQGQPQRSPGQYSQGQGNHWPLQQQPQPSPGQKHSQSQGNQQRFQRQPHPSPGQHSQSQWNHHPFHGQPQALPGQYYQSQGNHQPFFVPPQYPPAQSSQGLDPQQLAQFYHRQNSMTRPTG